jgi:carboxylesterase
MTVIMPGAEPFFYPGNDIGCLLVHGFTASPQEMRGLGGHLAQQGHTVLGVRLPGHGVQVNDMNRHRWQDWLAAVEDGYHLLKHHCSQIVSLGFSTGGVLSVVLAGEFHFAGHVLLSTPIELPPIRLLKILYPVIVPVSWIVPLVPKGKGGWYDPAAELERVAYQAYPLRAVREFGELVRAMRPALATLRQPALIMHSRDDDFVPPAHAQRIYDQIASVEKTLEWVDGSNHIITCDAARNQVFAACAGFVKRTTEPQGEP